MDAAKSAVSSFLGRDGKHKTDVDEVYVEAICLREITTDAQQSQPRSHK